MQLYHFLNKKRICIDNHSHSKTAVLLKVSQLLSQDDPALQTEALFEAYWHRESLGSTTLGHGVLIPHIRYQNLLKTKACFLRLLHPVDFGAEDRQPIDLVIGLLVPENQPEQHLTILSSIVKEISCADFRLACRQTTCSEDLYQLLTDELTAMA